MSVEIVLKVWPRVLEGLGVSHVFHREQANRYLLRVLQKHDALPVRPP